MTTIVTRFSPSPLTGEGWGEGETSALPDGPDGQKALSNAHVNRSHL